MGTNIFNTSPNGGNYSSKAQEIIIGRVKKVILGPYNFDDSPNEDYNSISDVGKIFFELMYSNKNTPGVSKNTPAYPIFSFVKQYPLISELVMIVRGPDPNLNDGIDAKGFYYFPPFSLWNSLNHNAFPNIEEYLEYVKDYVGKQGVGPGGNNDKMPDLPLGYSFSEKEDIRQLKIFEGDSIIESRFGSSIRFGSTTSNSKKMNSWSNSGKDGNPITIIRNGQGTLPNTDKFNPIVEDLYNNDSSIWLTSGQSIFSGSYLNRFPMRSFGISKFNTTGSNISNSQTVHKSFNDINISNNTRISSSLSDQDKNTFK